ncbi:tRNA-dependent cyclodipeptide synthase [Nonomuraea sp. NPDC002799]
MDGTRAGRGRDAFAVEPYTDNCRDVCERAEHVLVGVSPGNGYFNKERLTALLRWVHAVFARVDVIVPDASLVHTYQAIGHDRDLALKYARQKSSQMCRRIARAREGAGIGPDAGPIRLLSEFAGHSHYQRLRAQADVAIAVDPALRQVLFDGSRKVLLGHLKGAEPRQQQIEEGMRYLTAEMPLCMDTPVIMGVPSSVAVYHQVLPFVTQMYASEHLTISPLQAHAVLRPAAATPGARDGSKASRPVVPPAGGGESRR